MGTRNIGGLHERWTFELTLTVEVTHSKNTRGKAAYEESLKQQKEESKSVIDLETVQMELQI